MNGECLKRNSLLFEIIDNKIQNDKLCQIIFLCLLQRPI